MKKEVIIHIGLHKTGTTSIQDFCMKNRNDLGEFDFVCRKSDGSLRYDGNSYFLFIRKDFFKISRSISIDIDTLEAAILSSQKDRVIVSTESLSWIYDTDELNRLKNRLKKISEKITIICYVRNSLDFAKSVFSEACKPHNCLSALHDFRYSPLSPQVLEDKFKFNYYSFNNLSAWYSVFNDENIIFRPFDKKLFYKENLICDFLKIVKIDEVDIYEKAINHKVKNISLSYLQILYLSNLKRFTSSLNSKLSNLIVEGAYKKISYLYDDRKFDFPQSDVSKFHKTILNDLNNNLSTIGFLPEKDDHNDACEYTVKNTIRDSIKLLSFIPLNIFGAIGFVISKKNKI